MRQGHAYFQILTTPYANTGLQQQQWRRPSRVAETDANVWAAWAWASLARAHEPALVNVRRGSAVTTGCGSQRDEGMC